MASSLIAQTGPNLDQNGNMVGEVEALKYINQPNTMVDLSAYKDYATWGAVNNGCADPYRPIPTIHTAGYATVKIGSKITMMTNIQHCHGLLSQDPGVKSVGTTAFKWNSGRLFPLKHAKSTKAFWTDHYVSHYVPVEAGKVISVKLWLATGAPTTRTNGRTAISVAFYPGWNGVYDDMGTIPPASKHNLYVFNWDNKTTATDHAYTFNFTPQFTGMVGLMVGGDMVVTPSTDFGAVWFKAITVQDGRSNGVVPVGSYSPNKFAQQYFIRFRNSGKVMVPDLGPFGDREQQDPPYDYRPNEPVKTKTMNPLDTNQMWTLQPSATIGYNNIWTKSGALTSGPYWWTAYSPTVPKLGDPWQQIQFVDVGGGYKRMKLGAKGPAGEDLYLTSYSADEDYPVSVYFGQTGGEDVQLLPAKDPKLGSRYQVKNVNSGKCLTVTGGSFSSGANIEQQTCNAFSNQIITLTAPATDYYGLRFQHSNQVMNIEGTAGGAWAAQRPYNAGSNSQMFTLQDHSNGTFGFQFRHSGQCGDIDVGSTANGARAKQNPCTNANRQRFIFVKVP